MLMDQGLKKDSAVDINPTISTYVRFSKRAVNI